MSRRIRGSRVASSRRRAPPRCGPRRARMPGTKAGDGSRSVAPVIASFAVSGGGATPHLGRPKSRYHLTEWQGRADGRAPEVSGFGHLDRGKPRVGFFEPELSSGPGRVPRGTWGSEVPRGTWGSEVPRGTWGSEVPRGTWGSEVPRGTWGSEVPRGTWGSEVPRGTWGSEVPRGTWGSEVPRGTWGSEVPRGTWGSEVPRGTWGSEVPRGTWGSEVPRGTWGSEVPRGTWGSDICTPRQSKDLLSGNELHDVPAPGSDVRIQTRSPPERYFASRSPSPRVSRL